VLSRPDRYDVIESIHGTFPFSKRELRFNGLLVARSTGLVPFYVEYRRFEESQWPNEIPGNRVGRWLRPWIDRRALREWRKSVAEADVVRVLNPEEASYLRETMRAGAKVLELGEGLSKRDADALAPQAVVRAQRLEHREVAVVGSWCLRKGAADWGEIMTVARRIEPHARFRFLGTGASAEAILATVGSQHAGAVVVVPSFEPRELPRLLEASSIGALPSYIEGSPFGILEQLAAGLPTVAYDVPGSRSLVDRTLLVRRGDAAGMGRRIGELLRATPEQYAALSAQALARAQVASLTRVADQLLDRYRVELHRLGSSGPDLARIDG
jgi:glycosyltransferase involved in cell wall biosynthesis